MASSLFEGTVPVSRYSLIGILQSLALMIGKVVALLSSILGRSRTSIHTSMGRFFGLALASLEIKLACVFSSLGTLMILITPSF